MKEFLIFFIEAFLFCTLTISLADLLWDWLIKTPQNDKVKKFQKRAGYIIWVILVLLKSTLFWFDEGNTSAPRLPVQYPYYVEKSVSGTRLLHKDLGDVSRCKISQFAIAPGKFYYACADKETEVKVFEFDSKSIRTANTGPVLRNFNPQYYWYHLVKIDLTGIIIFALIQLGIMYYLQKRRSFY